MNELAYARVEKVDEEEPASINWASLLAIITPIIVLLLIFVILR
jgi:hypothetical protein